MKSEKGEGGKIGIWGEVKFCDFFVGVFFKFIVVWGKVENLKSWIDWG